MGEGRRWALSDGGGGGRCRSNQHPHGSCAHTRFGEDAPTRHSDIGRCGEVLRLKLHRGRAYRASPELETLTRLNVEIDIRQAWQEQIPGRTALPYLSPSELAFIERRTDHYPDESAAGRCGAALSRFAWLSLDRLVCFRRWAAADLPWRSGYRPWRWSRWGWFAGVIDRIIVTSCAREADV